MVAEEAVEVWDALTLKLLSTMQSPTVTTRFKHGIAYSPDGHCLAGCSSDAIIIWDIQTGGVVRHIKCRYICDGLELVWSLDGEKIMTVSQREWTTYNLTLYGVASGATLSSETVQSWGKLHFWANKQDFQIITTIQDPEGCTVDVLEVGMTLTKIKSFPVKCCLKPGPFSSTTHRMYFSTFQGDESESVILDIETLETLLQEKHFYKYPSFSPDGNLFAASTKGYLSVWTYTPSGYTQWRKIQQSPIQSQFSPTLPSIFGHEGAVLYVLHLDYSPVAAATAIEPIVTPQSQLLDSFSLDGTFVATTYHQQSTITITNLNSPNPFPSQFIDTDLEVSEIVLTGNVLLVYSSETIVGWLLTEDGVVDGIIGNSRADQNDSLWKVSPQSIHPILLEKLQQRQHSKYLEFLIRDEVAAIRYMGFIMHTYHIRTGEIVEPVNRPQYPIQTWYRFNDSLNGSDSNLYHHQCNENIESSWIVSKATLQEGWVKDPEGKHRLWLHPHWLTGNEVNWLDKVTTLRLKNQSGLVVIKF